MAPLDTVLCSPRVAHQTLSTARPSRPSIQPVIRSPGRPGPVAYGMIGGIGRPDNSVAGEAPRPPGGDGV